MPSIICADAKEFKDALLEFNQYLGCHKGLKAAGEETMGGCHDAPRAFEEMCVAAFSEESITLGDISGRAARLASKIVTQHIFHDGNGRTSMYAIYLFSACWKCKVTANPVALHAYMFGEATKDKIPAELEDEILEFMESATEKELRSHLSHIKIKLLALEDVRKKAKEWLASRPPKTAHKAAVAGANEGWGKQVRIAKDWKTPGIDENNQSQNHPRRVSYAPAALVYAGENALTVQKTLTEEIEKTAAKRAALRFQSENKALDNIRGTWKYPEPFPMATVMEWIRLFYKKNNKFPTVDDYAASISD